MIPDRSMAVHRANEATMYVLYIRTLSPPSCALLSAHQIPIIPPTSLLDWIRTALLG